MVEWAMLVCIVSVGVYAGLQGAGKGTRDALCSPVGGLDSVQTSEGEIAKYHYDDETGTCAPVQNNFYWN